MSEGEGKQQAGDRNDARHPPIVNDDADTDYNDDTDSDDEAPDLIALTPESDGTIDATAPAVANNSSSSSSSSNINNDAIAPPCPVTILSGFLGSGKTTLISYILKSPDHGKRIAVIENEFGEGLAIESLIARDGIDPGSNSLTDLIELPNGCVCCTVKDSLVETLENLITKRSDLDYILIEASGMADPGPIASVFWLDDALESRLKLDGIVTLVDGRHILEQLEATEEAVRQIAYADRIILNKVDLLEQKTEEQHHPATATASTSVVEVERELRKIHPTAPILRTSFSKIPNLDWILDADCFSGFDHLEEVETTLRNTNDNKNNTETNNHGHNHDHHSHHHDDGHDCSECSQQEDTAADKHHHHHQHNHKHNHKHKHTASISTVAFERPGSVDVSKLNAWLADILWPNQDETDKVLTAMLHHQQENDEDTADVPVTQEGHIANDGKTETNDQKIFRIKGIVSVRMCDDYNDQLDNNDNDNDNERNNDKKETNNGNNNDDDDDDNNNNNNSNNHCDSDDDAIVSLDQRRFIIQAVHDLWDIQPVTSNNLNWGSDEERTGKIVVIGKFLQEDNLRAGFEACFLP